MLQSGAKTTFSVRKRGQHSGNDETVILCLNKFTPSTLWANENVNTAAERVRAQRVLPSNLPQSGRVPPSRPERKARPNEVEA